MDKTIIFLHIPKTGGSTFHTILRRNYPVKNTYNVFGSDLSHREVQDFIQKPDSEKTGLQLIKGHMPYGLHEFIPGESTYITFLRDPIERVISQYYYVKKNPNHEHYAKVHKGNMSLAEFVESGVITGMNNGQCRFLTGSVKRLPYNKTDGIYEEAKANLDKNFSWVGITERFDDSILTLQNTLGWSHLPVYIKQNVSKIRKKTEQFSESEISVVKAFNEADISLYQLANSQLDLSIQRDSDFQNKKEKLSRTNSQLTKRFSWLPDNLQFQAINLIKGLY